MAAKKKIIPAVVKKTEYKPKAPPARRKGELRAENIKPYQLFKLIWNGSEEIHLALPHEYNYQNFQNTLKLSKDGKNVCCSYSLPINVDWDYKVELVPGSVKIEVADGKITYKLVGVAVNPPVVEAMEIPKEAPALQVA